jgi:hypothetical protein
MIKKKKKKIRDATCSVGTAPDGLKHVVVHQIISRDKAQSHSPAPGSMAAVMEDREA